MTRSLPAYPPTSIDVALRLISPEPARLAKPLSWQAAVNWLTDRLMCRAADPALGVTAYEESARQAIFDKVSAGSLTAFVGPDKSQGYHALSQDVWSGRAREFVDPLKLRNTGLLILYCALLPSCAAAREFDGRPLILDDSVLRTALRIAPSSAAELQSVGKAVVREALALRTRLTKAEFRDQVRARGVEASDRRIDGVRIEVAPASWRGGGRPSHRGNSS